MSSIALTWELGAGTGHLTALAIVGGRLAARGHQVFYLLRNLAGSLDIASGKVLQAPLLLQETRGFPEPPLNYSEILLRYGYHNTACLSELVRAWVSIYHLIGVDVVVADHAPTSVLASRVMGLPTAVIGSGFIIPPRQVPMPNMRPWMNVDSGRLAASDSGILNTINQVLSTYGKQPLLNVSSLLDVDERFLTTFPELDHYTGRVGESYAGPIHDAQTGEPPIWPAGSGKKVFVYLLPQHRDFSRIIELLSAMGVSALICSPGIPDAQRNALETSSVRISSRKFRLSELNCCDLAITYGSAGIVAAMLLEGIPMLMMPMHLEQFVGALRVQELGAGRMVNPDVPSPSYVVLLKDMLESPTYREKAQNFAQQYASYNSDRAIDGMVDRIEALARRGNA
jgi:UDP:flavonoid glycosyltransferase YjiC (YdhE family)